MPRCAGRLRVSGCGGFQEQFGSEDLRLRDRRAGIGEGALVKVAAGFAATAMATLRAGDVQREPSSCAAS
jgi:hypothetical protein